MVDRQRSRERIHCRLRKREWHPRDRKPHEVAERDQEQQHPEREARLEPREECECEESGHNHTYLLYHPKKETPDSVATESGAWRDAPALSHECGWRFASRKGEGCISCFARSR